MTTRSKFRIPTVEDMKKSGNDEPKVQSLFSTHQAAVRANLQKKSSTVEDSTETSGNSNKSQSTAFDQSAATVQKKGDFAAGEVAADVTATSRTADAGGGMMTNVTAGDSATVPTSSLIKPVKPDNPGSKNSSGQPKTNSLLVSTRQRGNPILKHIRNVPWEFDDIVPDYQMGQVNCALFLSLRYHQLNPNYIQERLKQLGRSYTLRVLLTLVDIKDPHHSLKELAKICILADCTLIVAFSQDEAGRYLETYRAYENKPPELIMERTEGNHMTRLTECLTKVRRVNKTDAMTLMSAFGSFENIVKSTGEDLSLCPGFGPQKAQRLHSAFHEQFVKSQWKSSPTKSVAGGSKGSPQKRKMDTS